MAEMSLCCLPEVSTISPGYLRLSLRFIQQLFSMVRNNMSEFSQEKIQSIVRDYIRHTLANDVRCRALDKYELEETRLLEGILYG